MKSARFQGLLVLALVVELSVWAALRPGPAALEAQATDLAAWRLRASRGVPDRSHFDATFVEQRLAELADPRADLRAALFVFSGDVNRLSGPRAQLEWVVDALSRPVERRTLLAAVLQLRKTGGAAVGASGAMGAQEWRWAARALSGEPWPADLAAALREHFAPLRAQVQGYLERQGTSDGGGEGGGGD